MSKTANYLVFIPVFILAQIIFSCEKSYDDLAPLNVERPVVHDTISTGSDTGEIVIPPVLPPVIPPVDTPQVPDPEPVLPSGEYYVATNGSDDNPGTIDRPFASWQKGIEACRPGETVYIRGGSYTHSLVADSNGYASLRIRSIHGSEGNMIHVEAYPGEKPVYDLSGLTASDRMKGVSIKSCSWVHFKGLSFTGATQDNNGYISVGMWAESVDNCIFEACSYYKNQGSGMYLSGSSEGNLILNCDFYDNYDSRSPSAGNNADGLNVCRIIERNGNERINTVRGCRAWHNSDDGFDFVLNPGYVYVDNCWSFNNGYENGNGNGFKLGENDGTAESDPQRIVTNCLAFNNKKPGFCQNESFVRMSFDHCIAYHNGDWAGFFFTWHDVPNIFTNCTSYRNNGNEVVIGPSSTQTNNSWNNGSALTDADFASLDATGTNGPRQSDGSLPNLNFLKMK
jgi:hypothetical protein